MLKTGTFLNKKYRMLLICAILGWLVSILGGMADSIIAGLYLDSEAVSAVGLISPITSMQYFFAILISIGTALMYSKALGAFEIEKSQKIAGLGMISCLGIGLLMMVVMIIGKDGLLAFYGCTGNVAGEASAYYDPIIPMAFIQPILWGVYNLVAYDGDEKICLTVDISMAVSNAVLSMILVQSQGIKGLAYGTLLSYVLGFVLLIPHFFKKSNSIHFKLYFKFKELLNIVKLSSASSLATLYAAIIDIIFNKIIIEMFGEIFLPAYAVVNVAMNFATFLLCAIQSGVVFISVNYGENNPYGIKRTMATVQKHLIIITVIFTAIMYYLANLWPAIYGITEPEVMNGAVYAGKAISITYIIAAFVLTYLTLYPAVDKPFEGNLLGSSYMLFGPLVVALPMAKLGGFNSMSLGFALTPVFSIVLLLVYLLVTKQIKKLPYLLPDTDEVEAHYDVLLTEENVVELRDAIGEFLTNQGVDDLRINEIKIIAEDTLVYVIKKNSKKVLCECDVLVNKDHIRLITKDNGVIFDMTKEADESLDLRCYVVARMMESTKEKSNTTTISFNRNTYLWERT